MDMVAERVRDTRERTWEQVIWPDGEAGKYLPESQQKDIEYCAPCPLCQH